MHRRAWVAIRRSISAPPTTMCARPILGKAPLGDVQARHDLETRQDGLRHAHGRRRHGLEKAVNAQTRLQCAAEGFDMQVGGALLDGEPEQLHPMRRYDRSAAGKVAQVVKVVGRRLRFLPARSCSAARSPGSSPMLRRCRLPVATTIATDCRNATSAARIVFVLDRPRNRQRQRPGRMLIGKEVLLLEKARREFARQRTGCPPGPFAARRSQR